MSTKTACFLCARANENRKKGKRIRCTIHHSWVLPFDSCWDFTTEQFEKSLEEIVKLKGGEQT